MNDESCVSEATKLTTANSVPEQRIATSFSITNLCSILAGFSLEKQEIVKSIGFGQLLRLLPQPKFPRKLAFWVLRKVDINTGQITFSKDGNLMVNEYDVELVIGIPRKFRTVSCSLQISDANVTRIRKLLLLKNDAEITLEIVEEILKREYKNKMSFREQEAFKVAFVLCADAYFLGPRGPKPRINQEMYINLVNTAMIPEFNWCEYVLCCFIQSSKRVQQSISCGLKTVTLDGCLLFPVVRENWYITCERITKLSSCIEIIGKNFL